MSVIPMEVKKKCIKLSAKGLTAREVYKQYYSKHYNTSFSGFRSMLKRWKNKSFADEVILESANLGYGYIPHDSTVQVNSSGEIVQAWIKQKSNADDSLYLELIEEIKKNTPHKEVKIINNPSANKMLEIPFFDMHWGIADLEYYSKTLNDILLLIDSKFYEEIYIIVGQDNFHNDNFHGTTTKGTPIEKVNMVKAWNDSKTFWYNIIDKALEKSNKVKVIYSKGNHDKAICWAFIQMLKERYGDIVDDSLDERKVIVYQECFIGLTHGEFKRNKPSDLRSQFSVKFPLEFAKAKIKEIHCGHLHTEKEEDEYEVMCRRLPTGNKSDEWTINEGYASIKRFMVFEWSNDRLTDIHYV